MAILAEVRGLRVELDRFRKEHNDFAVRTANEIDKLFAKNVKRPARSRLALQRRPSADRAPGRRNCPSIRKKPNSLPVNIKD